MWLLAYALERKLPASPYPFEWGDLFYLPQTPALQIYPVATSVEIAGIRRGGENTPELMIDFRQGNWKGRGLVSWNGKRFVSLSPTSKENESFRAELDEIESIIFNQQDFSGASRRLNRLVGRIRSSAHSTADKNELLLEIYYHQAICYRKLGQLRRAAATLSSLWRGYPDSGWGKLAREQLSVGGETARR
jgi:hypothetical protein